MRWNEKKKPKLGDTKTITKFLIFPKKIKGQWRWLEMASWVKKYDYAGDEFFYRWYDQDWLENYTFDKLTL